MAEVLRYPSGKRDLGPPRAGRSGRPEPGSRTGQGTPAATSEPLVHGCIPAKNERMF
jgi:hypothetical protein